MSNLNHLIDSGLGDMSLKWLGAATRLPPITSTNDALPSLSSRTVQCALAFFPVNGSMAFGKNGTCCVLNSEKTALMDLFRHQVHWRLCPGLLSIPLINCKAFENFQRVFNRVFILWV